MINKLLLLCAFISVLSNINPAYAAPTDSTIVREKVLNQDLRSYVLYISRSLRTTDPEHFTYYTVNKTCPTGYSACTALYLTTTMNSSNTPSSCEIRDLRLKSVIGRYSVGGQTGYRVGTKIVMYAPMGCLGVDVLPAIRGGEGYFTITCIPVNDVDSQAYSDNYCVR